MSVRQKPCAWLGNDNQIWTLDSMADGNPLINSIVVAVGVGRVVERLMGGYPTFCVKRYDRQAKLPKTSFELL